MDLTGPRDWWRRTHFENSMIEALVGVLVIVALKRSVRAL